MGECDRVKKVTDITIHEAQCTLMGMTDDKLPIVLPNTYYIVASCIWSFRFSVSFNPPSNLVS